VPDVAFCFFNDWQVVPKYAWTGQLADCSDIVNDLKPRYNEKMLAVAHVLNGKTKKRACYGVPIEAQTMHIHLLARHAARGGDGRRARQDSDEVGRVLGLLEEGSG